jgi:predicted amidophosphoribosyltransferase
LSWHSKPGKPGKPALTALGDLVHLAKSYDLNPDSAGSLPAAGLIAEQMVEFVRRHPLYRHSEGIVAALPSNPEKAFDLPHELAKLVSEDTSIPFLDAALVKKRRTAQMKCCPVLADKLDNITDSVGVREGGAAGKNLILIDDILESGATIQETAQALSRAGARRICGLVATKTLRCTFK